MQLQGERVIMLVTLGQLFVEWAFPPDGTLRAYGESPIGYGLSQVGIGLEVSIVWGR